MFADDLKYLTLKVLALSMFLTRSEYVILFSVCAVKFSFS